MATHTHACAWGCHCWMGVWNARKERVEGVTRARVCLCVTPVLSYTILLGIFLGPAHWSRMCMRDQILPYFLPLALCVWGIPSVTHAHAWPSGQWKILPISYASLRISVCHPWTMSKWSSWLRTIPQYRDLAFNKHNRDFSRNTTDHPTVVSSIIPPELHF